MKQLLPTVTSITNKDRNIWINAIFRHITRKTLLVYLSRTFGEQDQTPRNASLHIICSKLALRQRWNGKSLYIYYTKLQLNEFQYNLHNRYVWYILKNYFIIEKQSSAASNHNLHIDKPLRLQVVCIQIQIEIRVEALNSQFFIAFFLI